jgi:hypothetical protein
LSSFLVEKPAAKRVMDGRGGDTLSPGAFKKWKVNPGQRALPD